MKLATLLTLLSSVALAQGLPIKSGASTDLLTIDPTTKAAKVMGPYDRNGNIPDTYEGALNVGQNTLLFYDPIEGATLQTNLWGGTTTTMTQTVGSGVLTLNASAITTANTNTHINTIKQFNLQLVEGAVRGEATIVKPTVSSQANQTVRIGFFTPNGATLPTDGCWLEWNAAGEFRGYLLTNSAQLQTAALTAPAADVAHSLYVDFKYDACAFWVDDVQVATIEQSGTGTPPTAGKLPYSASIIIGAATPAVAPRLLIYTTAVQQMNIDMARDYRAQMTAGAARGAYQSPTSTYTQTSNHANSTSPTSATLSNTAAGYTTLGGRYQFAAPVGATTDFALFGYQVPTGFQLHVLGVSINACNTGAAVATTATILDWGVAVGSSAVSLATTDALGPPPTTWQPRRIPLGMQGMPLTAPNGPFQIGDCANDIVRTFDPPLVVDSGRFFHVTLQVPVGTATASQVIRGDVMVNGWFE